MARKAIGVATALAVLVAFAAQAAAAPPKAGGAPATTKAICPITDKVVDTKTAPHSMYKGTTYYFCTKGCLAAFKKAPEKALDRQVKCPACGMKLALRDAKSVIYKDKALYACTADCKRMIAKNPGKYLLPKQ